MQWKHFLTKGVLLKVIYKAQSMCEHTHTFIYQYALFLCMEMPLQFIYFYHVFSGLPNRLTQVVRDTEEKREI